jgi:hypothetical protein
VSAWRLTLAGLLAAVALDASAQTSITLYIGYAASEGIDNSTTNSSAKVDSGASFAAAFDYGLDPSRQLQLFYSQQNTQLAPGGTLAPFDFTVRYLHIGGTSFVNGPIGEGVYVVGGLGATQMSPSLDGLDSEIKPSLNLGIGFQWPIAANLALRAEARAFFTLINSSGNLFCSGGCVATLKGDAFVQGAAMVGLSGRF